MSTDRSRKEHRLQLVLDSTMGPGNRSERDEIRNHRAAIFGKVTPSVASATTNYALMRSTKANNSQNHSESSSETEGESDDAEVKKDGQIEFITNFGDDSFSSVKKNRSNGCLKTDESIDSKKSEPVEGPQVFPTVEQLAAAERDRRRKERQERLYQTRYRHRSPLFSRSSRKRSSSRTHYYSHRSRSRSRSTGRKRRSRTPQQSLLCSPIRHSRARNDKRGRRSSTSSSKETGPSKPVLVEIKPDVKSMKERITVRRSSSPESSDSTATNVSLLSIHSSASESEKERREVENRRRRVKAMKSQIRIRRNVLDEPATIDGIDRPSSGITAKLAAVRQRQIQKTYKKAIEEQHLKREKDAEDKSTMNRNEEGNSSDERKRDQRQSYSKRSANRSSSEDSE